MMQRIYNIVIGSILLILSGCSGYYTTVKEADRYYGLMGYDKASKLYTEAFSKRETYYSAKMSANSYDKQLDYPNSYHWWKQVALSDRAVKEDFIALVHAANQNGSLDEVRSLFHSGEVVSQEIQRLAIDSLLEQLNGEKIPDVLKFGASSPESADFGMVFDRQGKPYFVSDRGRMDRSGSKKAVIRFDMVSHSPNTDHYDWTGRDFLWVYRLDQQGNMEALPPPVPGTVHFSDIFFLENQPVVFYTVIRDQGKNWKTTGSLHPELYYSNLDDEGNFLDHHAFPYNNTGQYGIITPFADEHNNRLYFASDMHGEGNYDLFYSHFSEDMTFGEPVRLGEDINTPLDERSPYVGPDRAHLYFSSKGHEGLGGFDIYKAAIHEDGSFSRPVNLGLPYNSPQDDFAYRIGPDRKQYFSSNRFETPGIMNLDNIYMTPGWLKLLAYVTDCEGNEIPGELEIHLENRRNKENIPVDGIEERQLTATLEYGEDYEISISSPGYFLYRDPSLNTEELKEDVLERTYRLVKIPGDFIVFRKVIYYDLDKSHIRENEENILNKTLALMQEYPTIELDVGAHTDSRASHEYNDRLSERRAQAVVDYLSARGIDRNRITATGYGERQLAEDCPDGVPCSEDRHQLNRRSELLFHIQSDNSREFLEQAFREIGPCDQVEERARVILTDKWEENASQKEPLGYQEKDAGTDRYYAIGGVFRIESNAAAFTEGNKKEGYHQAGYFFHQEKKCYYAYLESFPDHESAVGRIRGLKENGLPDVWVLTLSD